ncbi:hypothetical protein BDN70DRAFT_883214 [Pholiota conissans]|uniref:DUF6697 domain-containing protein n=1 Tax=Pholiota conissans TaxID=109636 RepID=A0A9P6CX23_9AGAR|nr:hypothetical protein BDN70DRAFT_883214 [Pholiota conissans]
MAQIKVEPLDDQLPDLNDLAVDREILPSSRDEVGGAVNEVLGNIFSQLANPLDFITAVRRLKLGEPGVASSLSPTDRLRQIVDGIFLPSLSSVRKRKIEEAAEDLNKLKLLKDPKIKKNLTALLPMTLTDRLKPIGLDIQDQYFTIDQVTREITVTRLFMASTYGGNMQATFPRPSQEFLDIHGMDDFMYLPTEYQPEAPQLPGAPGLWLRPGSRGDLEGQQRVFSKIILAGGAKMGSRYQYQGQYEVRAANPPTLTVQEWRNQPTHFHNKWAEGIVKMGWGAGVCARVVLRRQLNREPTQNEVEEVISNGLYRAVTAEEIKEAYLRGKERMGICTMKCVGYDNRFQQELHDRFPTWTPPPPRSKKKQTKTLQPADSAEPRSRRGVKRKGRTNEAHSSDAESDTMVEDEDSASDADAPKAKRAKRLNETTKFLDGEQGPVYRSRGTRSRPILVG